MDSTGAVIPGSSVTIREINTNITKIVESNASGVYVSGPVKIGVYEIAVETAGFKKSVRTGVEIHPGDRLGINFNLEVGDVVEVVEVTGTTPLLETESSSLAYTVERRQIEELPISGRNYQSLALLSAGVAPEIGGRDRGPLGDARIGGGFVSHGQSALQNNFLIDGVDNNSTIMGMQDRKAQAIIPSMDAVQEFKVQTSNYSAEYGRNAGAVVNVTIRGGTNQFHGSAYEFVRNDAFDAREAFGRDDRDGDGKADPEVLRQNQYGVTFGGPVVKDKAFFFGSYEGWRLRKSQSDIVTIPSALERQGDFSQTAGLSRLKDPLGDDFPNKVIPQSRFDPVFERLVDLYPSTNFSDNTRRNFVAGPPWQTDRDQYDFRYDQAFTANDSFFARYSHFRFDNLRESPLGGIARGGVGNDRGLDDNDGDHFTASYTKVINDSTINEFRFGLKHLKVDKNQPIDQVQDDLNQEFGIKGLPRVETILGLPRFQLTGGLGMTGLGGSNNLPNKKVSDTYQFVDNLTLIKGNHSFKMGADIRYDTSDILGSQSATGTFRFNGRYTGIALGDGLLGWVDQGTSGTPIAADMYFSSWMFYFQDDWKLSPTFTLNLGIRYELTTPWIEKDNKMNRVAFGGSDFGRIIRAGELSDSINDRALVNFDKNNWAPRIGFAWQPGQDWTVRAGTGIFYGGQQALGASARMLRNFPFVAVVSARGNSSSPIFMLEDGFPSDFLGDLDAPVTSVADLPNNSVMRTWSREFPYPQVYQWNFSVQRQVTDTLALTVAYVGSSTKGIMFDYNINGPGLGDPDTQRERRFFFPSLNGLTFRSPAAHSSYNGMDVTLTKRFANGFSFTSAYTWSHGLGQTAEQFVSGDNGGPQDISCFSCDRGNNSNDVRQRFITNYMLELPFGRGKPFLNRGGVLNAVLGGWQMTGILTLQTGQYYDVTLANASSNLGTNALGPWRPNVVGDHVVANPTPDRWFNPDAFTTPLDANGNPTFGNLGRNALQEGGIFNWDVGLMKNFRLTEHFGLQFRWEVFNVTNHPSYGTPNTNISSPDAGIINSTLGLPRQMQFGVRLSW
ncbi:MAG: TonB-dependent receptor [bacterium]|nr:TonB-dependent receptor [bacterium]